MNIRHASINDIEGIWKIYNKVKLDYSRLGNSEYETQIQRSGFLIGNESKEDIASQIESNKFFLVAEEDSSILGYLRADEETEYIDDEYKTWFDINIKDIYYSRHKGLSVLALAVDTENTHKGIGSALLNKVENLSINLGYEYLFTVITISPITNCPMISWRTKVGFKRLAMGKPKEELFGIKWYASILMYKYLNS